MKLVSFCFVMLLALLYVGVTIAETVTYHKWEQAVVEQKTIQTKAAFYQRLNVVLDQLVHRMAYDSTHDPALTKILAEHRVKVVIANPAPLKDPTNPDAGTSSLLTPDAPPSADKPMPPSAGTAPYHP